MSAVTAWRAIQYKAFSKREHNTAEHIANARRHFVIGALLSGIAWGVAAYLLIPDNNAVHQAMVIAVLIGIAAGSVVTLSPVLPAAYGYLFLVLTPLIARLLTMGSTPNFALGIMTILFLYIMWSAVRDWHKTLRETLWVRREQEQAKAIIEHLAYHDDLTDLPNRRQLVTQITEAIQTSNERNQTGAVLFLDLDRFKTINASIGHQVGDHLLIGVSRRLRSHLHKPDVAARLGGDEFIVLLDDLGSTREQAVDVVTSFVDTLQSSLAKPFELEEHELQISSSVGVALFPHDSEDVDDLLKYADTAMYRSKADGRNTTRFFAPDMQVSAERQLTLEKGLHTAIDNHQLQVFYQPIVSLSDGAVTGVEALVRWQHPQLGLIPPGEFIPLAEESNLILALGEYVMRSACRDIEIIRENVADFDAFTLSINISPREFYHDGFVDRTLDIIGSTGLSPAHFQLELTEGVLSLDVDSALSTMARLKTTGVKLAIDDFGTGHSSLAYLKHLPIDTLKIDQSFILTIDTQPVDATIVANTIRMAKQLELTVIAEGIETSNAIDLLREYNCDEGQGYHYCHALPLNDLCH